jgi:hypothetical protein
MLREALRWPASAPSKPISLASLRCAVPGIKERRLSFRSGYCCSGGIGILDTGQGENLVDFRGDTVTLRDSLEVALIEGVGELLG